MVQMNYLQSRNSHGSREQTYSYQAEKEDDLLQRMKVKSESEVSQSCPTLSDPMDWSLLGPSAHGIF